MQRLKRAGGQNKVGGQRKSRDQEKVEGEKGWEAEEAHKMYGKGCPERGLKFNGFLRQDRAQW